MKPSACRQGCCSGGMRGTSTLAWVRGSQQPNVGSSIQKSGRRISLWHTRERQSDFEGSLGRFGEACTLLEKGDGFV